MIKLISTSLLVAAICLFLGACTTSERTTSISNSNAGGLKANMSDSDLEKSIKAKIDSDVQLKAADIDVDADADTSQVTLSGTVDSQSLKTRAIDLAKSSYAGLTITDKIEVKSREVSRTEYTEDLARQARDKAKSYGDKIGDTLDDAWIHTKIVAKLITNSNTPERKINVDVVKNTVTLRGTVDTVAQKTEAETVAKNTDGVKNVINQLKVGNTMAKTEPAKK
jgi:hyperosmotically inducible periplasmic protein